MVYHLRFKQANSSGIAFALPESFSGVVQYITAQEYPNGENFLHTLRFARVPILNHIKRWLGPFSDSFSHGHAMLLEGSYLDEPDQDARLSINLHGKVDLEGHVIFEISPKDLAAMQIMAFINGNYLALRQILDHSEGPISATGTIDEFVDNVAKMRGLPAVDDIRA